MRYFTPSEFQGWFRFISQGQLKKLDRFRHKLGYRVDVSPAKGAVGRMLGTSTSRHNYQRYHEVLATDVLPSVIEPDRWIAIAKEVGFHGIGLYPDWRPSAGLHLDDRDTMRIATWAGIRKGKRQIYVPLSVGLEKLNDRNS